MRPIEPPEERVFRRLVDGPRASYGPVVQMIDCMTASPETVFTHTPLATCARRMLEHGYRHLPVVGGRGELRGVLPDFAVDQAGTFVGVAWILHDPDDRTTAGERMLPVDVVARAEWQLVDVLHRLMASWQDVAVVVDEDERPIGIFTEHDVTRLGVDLIPRDLRAREQDRPLIALPPQTSANAAFGEMVRRRIRHVLVVDERRTLGVVSFRDLAAARVTQGRQLRLGDVPRRPLTTIRVGTPIAEAAALMNERKIECVPIIDPSGSPVGLITATDLLAHELATLEGVM